MLTRAKETARYFSISIPTLHRWRKEAGFPQPLQQGQVVLYDIEAIKQWMKEGDTE